MYGQGVALQKHVQRRRVIGVLVRQKNGADIFYICSDFPKGAAQTSRTFARVDQDLGICKPQIGGVALRARIECTNFHILLKKAREIDQKR